MRRFLLIAVAIAAALPALMSAATRSYDVAPYRNCIAVETLGTRGVSQLYRNTLDELTFVWFWVGDTYTSDRFRVEIRDSVTSDLIAQTRNQGSHASQCWSWLPCTLVTTQGRTPVRGRTYKVVVSRPSGGAISFAYDTTDRYIYGDADVPNSTPPLPAGSDIALRVSGLMGTTASDYWGNSGEFRGHNKRLLTAGELGIEWCYGTMGSARGAVGSSSHHSARNQAAAGVLW